MKLNYFFIFLFLLGNSFLYNELFAQIFKINGKIEGQNSGSIVLGYSNSKNQVINDTCIITNGAFSFSGFISEPTLAFLSGETKSRTMDDPNRTELFIEPSNMTIYLTFNDFKHLKVMGSKTQTEMSYIRSVKDSLFRIMQVQELQSVYMELAYKLAKDKENQELQNSTQNAYNLLEPFREALKNSEIKFIISHPKSYLSPYLMRFYYVKMSPDSLKKIYESFDYNIQNSFSGKLLKDQVLKKFRVGEGNQAINFRSVDVKGEAVELSSIIKSQKYVLLDFWASWCIPCRQGSPHLKELYKKYQAMGLAVICISSDRNKEDWEKAILKDKTTMFRHVLDDLDTTKFQKGETNQKNINSEYVIGLLPTKILIDKNGVIVFRSEGANDSLLDKKLFEIFGF